AGAVPWACGIVLIRKKRCVFRGRRDGTNTLCYVRRAARRTTSAASACTRSAVALSGRLNGRTFERDGTANRRRFYGIRETCVKVRTAPGDDSRGASERERVPESEMR